MPTPELRTVREIIAWSYANLACAHAALKDGRVKHARTDWMIRAKLFRGLKDGSMRMGGLFDDERRQAGRGTALRLLRRQWFARN